jgi:hypothetical protein
MEELFCIDGSIVLVNLELPLVLEASICKALNKIIDAMITVLGLSDHIGAKITHLAHILGETSWQRGLMAQGGE